MEKKHSDFLQRPHERLEMINELCDRIPVRFLCRHFGVGSSNYYQWLSGAVPSRLKTKARPVKRLEKSSNPVTSLMVHLESTKSLGARALK